MIIINKLLEINNKWKRKYNKLYIQYCSLAEDKINKLENENKILLKNIQYRDEIDKLKEELKRYKRKYGRLKDGDKNDKNKS